MVAVRMGQKKRRVAGKEKERKRHISSIWCVGAKEVSRREERD